mgnify:CR=1 FL=1
MSAHSMDDQEKKTPNVKTGMLIRRPVPEVFEAFVNPDITTKFWFTKSSGKLERGKEVRWDWEMYDVFTNVVVKELIPNERILIQWDDPPVNVEWRFMRHSELSTFVSITNWGFYGTDEEAVVQALDSQGGFTLVLAGLKALLEHNVVLNLVVDRFPEGCPK